MGLTLLRRTLRALAALIGVILVVFVLLRLSGDPSYILLPLEATDQQRTVFRSQYGLDQPLPVQFVVYLARCLRGDLGQSFSFQIPAGRVVMQRLPATLELAVAALALALVIAIPTGVLAATRRGTRYDRTVMGIVLLGQSVPTFWLGMVMILVVAVRLHLLPASGRGTWAHLVMPAVALALWLMALLARVTRSEMLEVLAQDYVRTARAKGISEPGIAAWHALRNALLPVVTVLGLQLGGLIGGAVMTETVFAWPGVGTMLLDAILKKDYPVVLAGVMVVAVTFIVINLALDLLYGVLDPRMRRA
jgi:peptide/nickel transport system permease protein